jgi:hypothetical protein
MSENGLIRLYQKVENQTMMDGLTYMELKYGLRLTDGF